MTKLTRQKFHSGRSEMIVHSDWWWWREFRYGQQLLSPFQILRYYCTITDTLILLEFPNSTNVISEEGDAECQRCDATWRRCCENDGRIPR